MKKLIALPAAALLLTLLVSLAGCGVSAAANTSPEGISATEAETETNTFGESEGRDNTAHDRAETLPPETEAPVVTEKTEVTEQEELPEDGVGIYSWLQGVKSYEKGREWSGDWCYLQEPGSEKLFSSFGCGICCLANMYSTLTGDECPPDVMYEKAKECSDYPGNGAIGWSDLSSVCEALGIPGTLHTAGAYEDFRQAAMESETLLVLVSSDYDDAIWKDLPGHYVNLWRYDPETDTVFLTDSGRPSNNRTRVSLEDVYRALYLADAWQYLSISKG